MTVLVLNIMEYILHFRVNNDKVTKCFKLANVIYKLVRRRINVRTKKYKL